MEFPSGDGDRPYRHHRRGEEDDPERRRRAHGDEDQYPPPRRDEHRYPSEKHHPYPPPGLSDPFRREDQRYPPQEIGGEAIYGEEIDRRPYSRPTSGYTQVLAPQVFDEMPHPTSGYVQYAAPQVFDERPHATTGYAQHVGHQVFGETERPYEASGYGQHVAPQVFDERPHATSGYAQHVSHQSPVEGRYGSGGYGGGGEMGGTDQYGGRTGSSHRVEHAASGYAQHVSHQSPLEGHYGSGGYGGGGEMSGTDQYGGRTGSSHRVEDDGGASGRKTVRVFTKAAEGFSLTIRDGAVVLARSDSSDERQHWFKDEKYNVKVKDEEGLPSFALVNKATGQAIKHSVGATQPVRLVPYDPDRLDMSVLWAESEDTGGNFHAIRMINNIRLNFDAFHGDKGHGGVKDGTTVVLWEWCHGDNQQWRIVPYS